jgi:hypothetical protein
MEWGKSAVILAASTLVISGCSSRPRYFVATLSPPAADAMAFDNHVSICRELVGRGYKSNFAAQAASIGIGTAAGTGVAVVSVQSAFSSAFLTSSGASAASTGLAIAAPFVGAAIGFGVSRIIRSGREKKLKKTLSDCLTEYGYKDVSWTPTKRPKIPRKDEKAPAVISVITEPTVLNNESSAN